MQQFKPFTKEHIFILPHAEEYRRFFDVSIQQILDCLNEPERSEGLATDHYTAEKTINNRRLHVYFYLTFPLQATDIGAYSIVDFIGCTELEDRSAPANKS
jgi:hypothetical protein